MKRQPHSVMHALADALHANYFATSRLTDGEAKEGWRMCSAPGACPRVPKGWVSTVPHAHRDASPGKSSNGTR